MIGFLDLVGLLRYLSEHPHEAERLKQCYSCRKLSTCDLGDEEEDDNRLCKYYEEEKDEIQGMGFGR